jgi:hypothetical protein
LWIEVECGNDQISNLDSLYQIIEVTNLHIIGKCSPRSITGLDSLAKVHYFTVGSLDSLNHQNALKNLKLIEELNVSFRDPSSNLNFLINVDTIYSVYTFKTGSFEGINENAKKTIEKIRLQDFDRDFKLSEITSKEKITSFGVLRSKNILIDSLFESIDRLSINQTETKADVIFANSNIRFSNIILNNVNVDFSTPFNRVDTLGGLWIVKVDQLRDLDSMFPNLVSIENSINLQHNMNLESFNFNNVEIPYGKKVVGLPDFVRIILVKNPKLNSCESNFLCRGYKTYPDSMIISENGTMCTPESILEYCLTKTNTVEKSKIKIYPNPAINKLFINSNESQIENHIRIINSQGQICLLTELKSEINIEYLSEGLYTIQLINNQNKIFHSEKIIILN